MGLSGLFDDSRINPLDVVERIASGNDWSFERAGDDEITILVAGRWSDYQISFTWMHDLEALHLACAFDLKVPERRRVPQTSRPKRAQSAATAAPSEPRPTTRTLAPSNPRAV